MNTTTPLPKTSHTSALSHLSHILRLSRLSHVICSSPGGQVVYKPGSLNGGEAIFRRASISRALFLDSMMDGAHSPALSEPIAACVLLALV